MKSWLRMNAQDESPHLALSRQWLFSFPDVCTLFRFLSDWSFFVSSRSWFFMVRAVSGYIIFRSETSPPFSFRDPLPLPITRDDSDTGKSYRIWDAVTWWFSYRICHAVTYVKKSAGTPVPLFSGIAGKVALKTGAKSHASRKLRKFLEEFCHFPWKKTQNLTKLSLFYRSKV